MGYQINTIDTVNEVTGLSDGTSFTYDSNGNRTGKTTGTDARVYTYDYDNRLTKVEKNSVTTGEYVYDGNGKRIRATEDSETTTYIYAGLNTLYEKNMTGIACYIYGPAGRLAKRTIINGESSMFYYHTDHLGSTRLVTDESGNIVSAVTYHPFGESDTEEGSEHFLFNEKEKDSIGLYYYGARYYDPETGRFISRDLLSGQIRTPQTLNRYTYVLNNPLKYRDPDGLEEAGALIGKGDYPGQGITLTWERVWAYVYWSNNPDWIGTEQKTGSIWCLVGMFFVFAGWGAVVYVFVPSGGAAGGAAAAWWGNLPAPVQKAIEIGIMLLIGYGITWYQLERSKGERFIKIEFDWGYWIYDSEIDEYVEGEMWKGGIHLVWVHVPGKGLYGGHWENDLDCDGVASSVDDDDTDPEVGDEDPDKP